MNKNSLTGINQILPFDGSYIKVGKGAKNALWNLMDKDGNLVSQNWFTSLEKNTDGSITAVAKTARRADSVPVRFLSTRELAKTADLIGLIPPASMNFLDSGTVTPYNEGNYIAKATMYGMTVFLDKKGNIYNSEGKMLRLLFNTVDSKRLANAINAFNERMHRGISLFDKGTAYIEEFYKRKISMWLFYWVDDEYLCLDTAFTNLVQDDNKTKKWTDDIILRVLPNVIPEDALGEIKGKFGEGTVRKLKPYDVLDWHFKKDDFEKILDLVQSLR